MRHPNFIWLLVPLLRPVSAIAADGGATQRAPTSGIGALVMWYICASRRKYEIGGWLLYYYIQLYIGVIVSVIIAIFSFRNYLPVTWAAKPSLYPLFLLSTVPQLFVLPVQLVAAEMLRKSRDYKYVGTLRLVLWIDLATAVVAAVIDLNSFKESLAFDVLALAWPAVWLPYFYVSKRVKRVFETKNWLMGPSASAVP